MATIAKNNKIVAMV